jgi:tetrapyrrole methylase family protein/MazG family protein
LREELGDLMLQIVLHTQIAVEEGEFSMVDVLQGINQKIVRRHPHVFAETSVSGVDGVLQNWQKLKEQERSDQGVGETKGMLDGVPKILPALSQSQEIQDRAARVGFDWPNIEPVYAKLFWKRLKKCVRRSATSTVPPTG